MKNYRVNLFYSEEDEGYIAEIPELGGCSAFGRTREEALAEIEIAKAAYLEAAHLEGKPVPQPLSVEEALRITRRSRQRLAGQIHGDSSDLIREDRNSR